jgi:hypothetical protein
MLASVDQRSLPSSPPGSIRRSTIATKNQAMTKEQATIVCKSINRHLRRTHAFVGGRQYGIDFNTWVATFPHLSRMFYQAAKVIVPGCHRPMPLFTPNDCRPASR